MTTLRASAIRPLYAENHPNTVCVGTHVLGPHASAVPASIPTAQPTSRAQLFNLRVKRPNSIAGKHWIIHTPPSSWKSMAYCVGTSRMTINAPSFTRRETTFASDASLVPVRSTFTNGFQMFRVKVFAAPMDMTAAGTSAPIAMAAKQNPTNQSGNITKSRICNLYAGCVSHEAEEPDNSKQDRVRWQRDRVTFYRI
jgi:hypothetical protein